MNLHKIKKYFKRIARNYFGKFQIDIDISSCNLRCAMCPRGGISGLKNTARGLMDLALFKNIIGKFLRENVNVRRVVIGNWGEPLLNPELPKMITYAKDKLETHIDINTNLTFLRNPVELLESGVDIINISISGMRQEVYSKNHRGGDIRVVLQNILRLLDIKNMRDIKGVQFLLTFHDFIYNKKDSELAMKFCQDHGLIFVRRKMYICSVEENILFHEEKEKVGKFYNEFIDLEQEMNLQRTLKNIKECKLLNNRVTINFDGQLYRCCGVFDQKYFMGSFFDYRIRNIPNIRSEICNKCSKTPISFR